MNKNALQIVTKAKADLATYKTKGEAILKESTALAITNVASIKKAEDIKKRANEVIKSVNGDKTLITGKLTKIIQDINLVAREVINPAETAKLNIQEKLLAFQEEQDRIKEEEEQEIQNKIDNIRTMDIEELNLYNVDKSNNDPRVLKAIEDRGIELERIEREEIEKKRQADERKKLEEQAKIQSAEKTKLDEERLALEQEKRELEELKKKNEEDAKLAETPALAKPVEETKVKGIRTTMKCSIFEPDLVPREYCSPDQSKIRAAIKLGVTVIPGIRIYKEKSVV